MGTTVTKPITRRPENLNSDTEELNETRFHSMIKFEGNLFRILSDTGVTHSYVGKELLEKILNLNYPISEPTSQTLLVANGETVAIIGQVVILIIIGKDVKHMSFRLVPKLKSTRILGTEMIQNLKMTLNYDTGTWWLPRSPPSRYHMEARLHSLTKPSLENTTSGREKATKTSKEDSNGIMENKINSYNKILTSVNNRIKSETKGAENNNKESKPKFGGEIKLKSVRENGKSVVGRNPNDFTQTQTYNNSNLSQKVKSVKNAKANPYKDIPSLFSIPIHNRFQILENHTLKTQDSNKNRNNRETVDRYFLY